MGFFGNKNNTACFKQYSKNRNFWHYNVIIVVMVRRTLQYSWQVWLPSNHICFKRTLLERSRFIPWNVFLLTNEQKTDRNWLNAFLAYFSVIEVAVLKYTAVAFLHMSTPSFDRSQLISAHQEQPLPNSLNVVEATPQVKGVQTIIRYQIWAGNSRVFLNQLKLNYSKCN